MRNKVEETLKRAASRRLSLKQQSRNSIRDVLSVRSNGSSIWSYVETLELQSQLPESLVDSLLVCPASGWRQERARKVAESLNNIAVSIKWSAISPSLIAIFPGSLL